MKLTPKQLNEVQCYILKHLKYKETYEELCDHILNALEFKDETFSLRLVQQIIKEDFGSFEQIAEEETEHRKHVMVKYSKLLWREMLDSFQIPRCFIYIILTWYFYMIYNSSLSEKVITNITYALTISATFPGVYYLYKRYLLDRKCEKPSLIYHFMYRTWFIGFSIVLSMVILVIHPSALFALDANVRFFSLYFVAICTDVYVRSFKRLYDKNIKVLSGTRLVTGR